MDTPLQGVPLDSDRRHHAPVKWGGLQNLFVTLLPWTLVTIVLTSICFSFYFNPVGVYVIIVICFCFAIGIAIVDALAGRKMLFYSGIIGSIGMLSACVIGASLYQRWLHQYYHIQYSRYYENVLPSESAAAHRDAGRLDFAIGSAVDASKSVGYAAGGHIYCAAPIRSADARIAEFWAIGIDCCSPRSSFTCDDVTLVGASDAKTGLVMLDYPGFLGWFMQSPFDYYHRAITQSKASFGLVGTDDPLLVRWVDKENADSTIGWYFTEPLLLYLFGLLVFGGKAVACALVIHKRMKRKAELARHQEEELRYDY